MNRPHSTPIASPHPAALWSITLLTLTLALPLSAASLDELIQQPIITPELAQEEVQAFTERRVPILLPPETVEAWETEARRIRSDVLQNVVFRGEAAAWRDARTRVEWLGTIEGGPGYQIKKLRYEALPGWWIPALLYEPLHLQGRVPVMLNVNGHDGAGKAADYKQIRCINQAKRGMLALNPEWIGMGQLKGEGYQHYRMNQLNLCGSSGLAPFYLAMSRAIDLLLDHPNADPQRLGVAGLSGGGWQTIFISSLDPRVSLANPVAGYSSFRTRARHHEDLGDSEQTPCDLAFHADYTHLTALLAPRPALLTFNAADNCCFASTHAMTPLLSAAAPVYRLYNKSGRLRFHVNQDPGDHNFGQDNRVALYRMLADFFDEEGNTTELEMSYELKTPEQLQVEIPSTNASFNSLSLQLSSVLPRHPAPEPAGETGAWIESKRTQLRQITRFKNSHLRALPTSTQQKDANTVTTWKLRIDDEWTVPALEVAPATPQMGTAILLSDGGRRESGADIKRLVSGGWRVVAVDPFYFGESRLTSRDFLFALLVDSVGERNLGIQTSQVSAIAGWLRERYPDGSLRLAARGPRTGTIALATAAMEPEDIGELELHEPLTSLKQIITENWPVTKAPELFCFGLLEVADIPQLKTMAGSRLVADQ